MCLMLLPDERLCKFELNVCQVGCSRVRIFHQQIGIDLHVCARQERFKYGSIIADNSADRPGAGM